MEGKGLGKGYRRVSLTCEEWTKGRLKEGGGTKWFIASSKRGIHVNEEIDF